MIATTKAMQEINEKQRTRLAEARKQNGLSQAELAAKARELGASIDQPGIARIERGHRIHTDQKNLVAIAKVLAIEFGELGIDGVPIDDAEWAYPSLTPGYASKEVLELFQTVKNHSALAIGECVGLYVQQTLSGLQEVGAQYDKRAPFTHDLESPTAEQLRKCIESHAMQYGQEVATCLNERVALSNYQGGGRFECKVGLRTIALPTRGQEFSVTVNPISYWIVENFNRLMVVDPSLAQLRESYLKNILAPNDFPIPIKFPSAFFVELALVTNDDKIVLLEKHPYKSVMAVSTDKRQQRRRFTCGIEEGFVWSSAFKSNSLDIEGTILRGLEDELGIVRSNLTYWKLLGVGLESPSLNSGLLGYAMLNLDSAQLDRKIRSHLRAKDVPDFFPDAEFIDIASAFEALSNLRSGLHPTALMRVYLASRSLMGQCLEK